MHEDFSSLTQEQIELQLSQMGEHNGYRSNYDTSLIAKQATWYIYSL